MSAFSPLTLSSKHLDITLLPYGASLVGVRFAGDAQNLVLGFDDPQNHARVPIFAGGIVGPVANRITGGRITIGGATYQMPQNEGRQTCLHSGPDGLHTKEWQVEDHTDNALRFAVSLPDGACGLPGNREITATYRVENQTLTLELCAVTDRTTVMNLAAHPYWNLDGQGDVSTHRLHVFADAYLPTNSLGLPSGTPKATKGTAIDFSTLRALPPATGIDVNFCLAPQDRTKSHPAARLIGTNGTALEIATSAPGLQVYTGVDLPTLPGSLSANKDLAPFGAIALEPQHWPNAPHNPAFPSILLHPGNTYRQISTFTLSSAEIATF